MTSHGAFIPWGSSEEEVVASRGGVGINDTDWTVDLQAVMKVLIVM